MTDRQIRFCHEYLVDMNATQACIRSGYSAKTAYAIGSELLRKEPIRAFIDSKIDELCLSSAEILKKTSDIARGSLNHYFIVKQVVTRPKVVKPLRQLIKVLEAQIEDADKLVGRIKLNAAGMKVHKAQQLNRKTQIVEYEIELERNPKASRIVDGPESLSEVAELDLARLVKDKEGGLIKSVSYNEYGPKVELYAADTALREMAKMRGLYEEDNKQRSAVIAVGYKNDDDE